MTFEFIGNLSVYKINLLKDLPFVYFCNMQFPQRLQTFFTTYNLTAAAFADAIAFNRSTISHLVSGRNKPSIDFILKVVEVYPAVSLEWLLTGKGQMLKAESLDTVNHTTEKSIPTETVQRPTLFDDDSQQKIHNPIQNTASLGVSSHVTNADLEKIILLYADGSFRVYNAK